MSKVFFFTHKSRNWSGISKRLDCTGDGLYVNDLTCSLTFPPSVVMKKWTYREISRGMYPTVIKLEKYLFLFWSHKHTDWFLMTMLSFLTLL